MRTHPCCTMEAVRERLWVKTAIGGVARYENDYYHQVSREIGEELTSLTAEIIERAGHDFDPGSPEQLSVILFDKLHLTPIGDRGKNGYYSTDKETLARSEAALATVILDLIANPVDEIVLVGGSTRMPKARPIAATDWPNKPSPMMPSVEPARSRIGWSKKQNCAASCQRPAFTASRYAQMLRRKAKMSAKVCSGTVCTA